MKEFIQIIVLLINFQVFVQCERIHPDSLKFMGNKMAYVSTDKASWHDANVICQNNGMGLLSIRSAEDTNEIEKLQIKEDFWSGGNNLDISLMWSWSGKPEDNNKFVYTNFEKSIQRYVDYPQLCISVFSKNLTWNERRCWNKLIFVCESVDYIDNLLPDIAIDSVVTELQFDKKPKANADNKVVLNSEKPPANETYIEHPAKEIIKLPNIYEIIKESMQKNGKFFNKIEFSFNNSNVTFNFNN